MIERQLDIATPDGAAETFISHPERDGPHPVILFLMDAPGIREELRDMCRRLASVGYYVIMPNLYYRQGIMDLTLMPEAERPDALDLMRTLTIPGMLSDVEAMLAFADADPAARGGAVGCVGYCMSGPFAIQVAARWPDRVSASASIHGVALVTKGPKSPHLMARQTKAELYFAAAEIDRWAPLEMIEELTASLKADKINAEVEMFPGMHHGFVFPDRGAAYDRPAAETHWERLFALFRRNL
jgi:carboxymethylenebutenolidase